MTGMNERIQNELLNIEKEEQVRIIYACESGSRAWGFPSRDSDYDVRFLYVRPIEDYLMITEKRDVIERPINDRLDINGWDLKKALRLFRKSNPPLLEWLQSPIRYLEETTVAERIRSFSPLTYSPKSCMSHYLHMAKGNYREYLQQEQVRIKKYFYVLRPVLACGWIGNSGGMPPVEFKVLAKNLLPEGSELKSLVFRLLERKKAGEELDYEPKLRVINDYLEERIAYYEQALQGVPQAAGGQDRLLDELFRRSLEEVWGGLMK
jgi:uncharacterized protein